MQVVLLHNENAGAKSWSRKEVTRLVSRGGFKPHYVPLSRGLKQPALLDRGEFVIVAGGDGAVRKAALALRKRGRPLAPLPLGTANNIARSFNLPDKPKDIVAGWKNPRRLPFDLGMAEGPWGKRFFVEGVGVGLISRCISVLAEIDRVSTEKPGKPQHKLHRDACVAVALAHEMQPLGADLSFDGREVSEGFLLLEILNIRRAGPAVELAPHASPSDGRFDVVSVTTLQRSRLLHTLEARLSGAERVRSLTTRRARAIDLQIHSPCAMRIDDGTVEVKADTNVQISIEPGALAFVLPG